MTNIFIVAAKRTPFGAFGGSLKKLTSTELGTIATKAALTQGNIDPSLVGAVYFGNVIQSSSDAAYLARHVGLKCGIPISTPALTINRLCGSGFETVIQGAKSIKLNEASVVVCGGSENMSMAPLQVDGNDSRWGGMFLYTLYTAICAMPLERYLWRQKMNIQVSHTFHFRTYFHIHIYQCHWDRD